MVAMAAAIETGFPPKVLKWMRSVIDSAISARVVQQATTQQPSTLLCGGVDHEAIGAKGGQDSSVQRLVVLKRPLLRGRSCTVA